MNIEVGAIEDLPPGSALAIEAGDEVVAVFNVEGTFYAIDGRCAHNEGPLVEGTVHDGIVTCPWHWWRYEVATGRRLGSDVIAQQRYRVTVEDGVVWVDVPLEKGEDTRSLREQLLEHARTWKRDA